MSNVTGETTGMIIRNINGMSASTNRAGFNFGPRVIAIFGRARLVRQPNGRHELMGGSDADGTEAREWCSLFAPEIVFRVVRPSATGLVMTA